GKPLLLNGRKYIVIGVMPASFEFPIPLFNVRGGQFAERVDIWKPVAFTPLEMQTRYSRSYGIIARLRPDVTPEKAQSELKRRFHNLSLSTMRSSCPSPCSSSENVRPAIGSTPNNGNNAGDTTAPEIRSGTLPSLILKER